MSAPRKAEGRAKARRAGAARARERETLTARCCTADTRVREAEGMTAQGMSERS